MDAASLFDAFRREGQKVLAELHAKDVLRAWGLPVPPCLEAHTRQEVIERAAEVGYPVVLKVLSQAILHKSNVGGVRLGLENPDQLTQAYAEIEAACRPLDSSLSFTVQPMLPPGVEVIVGTTIDPHFGSVVMFGLGGTTTELFKDTVFRVPPLDHAAALAAISSIKTFPLLKGYRGQPARDIDALADILVSVSSLLVRFPFILELDLNPVLAYERGAAVADARIVLRE